MTIIRPAVAFAAWVVLMLAFVVFIAILAAPPERGAAGPLIDAACRGDVATCERLVKGGLPVDAADAHGDTALNWAIDCRKIDVVRKLTELGADVNHANRRPDGGFTPLMYTAWPFRGKRPGGTAEERNDIARLLIGHGADVNRTTGGGRVPLHFAAADRNAVLVRMLLAAGADRSVRSKDGYTPLDVARFPSYAPNEEVVRALEGA